MNAERADFHGSSSIVRSVKIRARIRVYPCPFSRENLADRFAALGDRDGPAGAVVDRHLRVDAEAFVNGGADVGGAVRVVPNERSMFVRGAVDRAAADARPRQDHRIAVTPVIATG